MPGGHPALARPLALVTTALILGASGSGEFPQCNTATTGDVVYFGAGQFYSTQFMLWKIERGPLYNRPLSQISALAGFAGGFNRGPSPAGQVCSANGPNGTDYGALGHTHAVQIQLDPDLNHAVQQFLVAASRYFTNAFANINGVWQRSDPQDRGPRFRDIIGVPGGLTGTLGAILHQANINGMTLAQGGNVITGWDAHGEGVVYVYDTAQFPFYRAERGSQFRVTPAMRGAIYAGSDPTILPEYRTWTRGNLTRLMRLNTTCDEQDAASDGPNIELPCCPKTMSPFNATFGPAVYFGDGNFWHTQFDMYSTERAAPFYRELGNVSARAGYGGGIGSGPNGQICGANGPDGTLYSTFGYAQAVQVVLDGDQRLQQLQMLALATQYFNNSFILVNGSWVREDPDNRGPGFRNVIGLPGGVYGPLFRFLGMRNIHALKLREGGKSATNGRLHDIQSEGAVFIYDTNTHPFFRAEQNQQFHSNAALRRPVPAEYLNGARMASRHRNAIQMTCGESGIPEPSNLESFSCPSLPWTPHSASPTGSGTTSSAPRSTSTPLGTTIQGQTSTLDSTTIASGGNDPARSSSNDSDSGSIAAVVVAVVVAVVLLIAAAVALWQYRGKKAAASGKYVVVNVKNPVYDHSLRHTAHSPQYGDADFSDAMSEPPDSPLGLPGSPLGHGNAAKDPLF